MIVTVASGKGGTGKTTVATNLALVSPEAQYIDCDVEEPNGHLFLKPEIERELEVDLPIPRIDTEKCTACGDCAKACEFNALALVGKKVMAFPDLCHGCGACVFICPEKAISESSKIIGRIETGKAPALGGSELEFAHGVSKIGNPLTPPIIKRVKKLARDGRFVIMDSPPGTSCPMVQTLLGSDYCLFVTEPTPFGLNDLELAVGVARQLEIPCGIVINRADSGDERIHRYCERERIPVLLEIPFDRDLAFAYSKGEAAVMMNSEMAVKFKELYQRIFEEVGR
ncbi:MAG: (4Fe-4S)-binding protein [Deltaproteobacteria bacterium]|nr:(4Fe-4S)-binding protein [Deltaproteobacteria bacterium]